MSTELSVAQIEGQSSHCLTFGHKSAKSPHFRFSRQGTICLGYRTHPPQITLCGIQNPVYFPSLIKQFRNHTLVCVNVSIHLCFDIYMGQSAGPRAAVASRAPLFKAALLQLATGRPGCWETPCAQRHALAKDVAQVRQPVEGVGVIFGVADQTAILRWLRRSYRVLRRGNNVAEPGPWQTSQPTCRRSRMAAGGRSDGARCQSLSVRGVLPPGSSKPIGDSAHSHGQLFPTCTSVVNAPACRVLFQNATASSWKWQDPRQPDTPT